MPSVSSPLTDHLKTPDAPGDPPHDEDSPLRAAARDRDRRWVGRGEPPRYVRRCEDLEIILSLVNKDTGESIHVPARCRSWRCRRCAFLRAWQDTTRIYLGAMGRSLREKLAVAYAVLTMDQSAMKERGVSVQGAYRELLKCFNRLRTDLRYHGLIGEFVVTVEQHRSGWPHVNMLMNGGYAEAVATGAWREARRDLRERAVRAGFGPVLWLDQRVAGGALFHYVAKYLSKSSQAPTAAPKGFRRIRSSAKSLAKVERKRAANIEWLGFLKWKEREEFLEKYLLQRMPEEEAYPTLMHLTRKPSPKEVEF